MLEIQQSFLQGGGELGARTRAYDWTTTPLGASDQWPQSLRSALSILLASKAQIMLFWGSDYLCFYNDAYRPVFGSKHPRMLGQPARVAWHEIWESQLKPLLDGVMRTGEAFWATDLLFRLERNGYPEETYFDVSYDPVRIESGAVGGVFCIVSETTERVIGARRVRTMRDLAARAAAARTPTEACVASVESLATNQHDVPFAVLLMSARSGSPAAQYATPGAEVLADASRWPVAAVLRHGEPRVVPLDARMRIRTPLGAWDRPATQALMMPLPASGGESPGILVFGLSPMRAFDEDYRGFLDLLTRQVATGIERSRAHEEDRKRAEALARLDRAKTAFFSNISHEFRTPLTLMLGPLEEVLLDASLGATDRSRILVAHRNALRLQKLVNTLLEFSRIEAGRVEARYEPTDLAGLTAELASNFRSAVERGGLRLVVDCPTLPVTMHVDHDMWERIVFNLLSNAFKFTLQGEIAVSLRQQGDHVELTVRDTGTGISGEHLPHLFERFYRVKEARGRSFEGTGIGLALVQELVKLHGGLIEVRSDAGRGTTFTISLPTGTSHLPPESIVTARARREGVRTDVSELLAWLPAESRGEDTRENGIARPRIVLADDNADMREYICRLLHDSYIVESVADGASALNAARERRPDLIIADIMMPVVDGFGLLEAVRADEHLRTVPLILLSARAGEEARVEGMAAGADDYLVKPFSARELRARVAARLELSRMREGVLMP